MTDVRKCPVCGKAAQKSHAPFCSARCKEVDLGRWFNELYRVPGQASTAAVRPVDSQSPIDGQEEKRFPDQEDNEE